MKKDNKVLITKRSPGNPNVFWKWEFPGGKVKSEENEMNAIEREIKEEFELMIKSKKFVINNICVYPTKVVYLRLYKCDYESGEFNPYDHSEYKWVNKEELLEYDLALLNDAQAKYFYYFSGSFDIYLKKIKKV